MNFFRATLNKDTIIEFLNFCVELDIKFPLIAPTKKLADNKSIYVKLLKQYTEQAPQHWQWM